MISILCLLIVVIVGLAMLGAGLFTAVLLLVNVVLAGILSYSFWEPLADDLEPRFAGTFLAGSEDFLCMALLFGVFLVVLGFVTRRLARPPVKFVSWLNRTGGLLAGLFAGYLLAGFLVCAMETLPVGERFLGFEPRSPAEEPYRRYFPPDRVWSALMRQAGANTLSRQGKDTFDPHGTFELRYQRYRRHSEKDGKKVEPLLWQKELEH